MALPVTIYTRAFCGYCARALRLLESKGAHVTEIDIGFDPDMREEMARRTNGRRTFPQIFIGETHIGGCDDLQALERAGKLEPMLAGM